MAAGSVRGDPRAAVHAPADGPTAVPVEGGHLKELGVFSNKACEVGRGKG